MQSIDPPGHKEKMYMADELRFDGKVAIVTGAGGGLGRSHALLFASRGAKVVVNDLGGSATGGGKSSSAADKVVAEIKEAGGQAVANYDSVEDGDKIFKTAIDAFGQVDILINNAGILRDTSFQKMTQDDWDLVYRVHVLGAYRCTKAVWDHMRDRGYGRIVFTASAAGIYGNFGQANYSMAKLGLLGFSNTLAIEGKKKNVVVNTIAPLAGSRLTETVLPKEIVDALKPEYVSPLVALLCHESNTDTGGLYEVGGGFLGKLRWERAEGKMFRLGSAITPEVIKREWKAIAGFDKTTHPADVTQSMGPIMQNVSAGPSKGSNQFIDVDRALGFEFPPMTSSYDERDLSLYALGIGAAHDPLDQKDLLLVYEMHGEGFRAFPTFGVIPAIGAMIEKAKAGEQAPGLDYGFDRILHGEQYLELKRPLPPKAKLTHKAKIKDIFDKGKNALVVTAIETTDESGEPLAYNEFVTVVRGAGGFGGDRGPSVEANPAPERKPDQTIEEKIPENQALLYRLTGDINPLHVDPSFATMFGFQKPILHGLCTFGFAARHVIKAFAGGDPRKFKSIKVRFADSVFPGETLITEMWKKNDLEIVFRCKVKERDKVVISNAAIELYAEIPQPKAKKPEAAKAATAGAAPAPAAASAEPISADVFRAIELYLESKPEMVAKVGTIFQFKLSSPSSAWLVDAKNGKGSVKAGEGTADVTLEMSDADFLGMCTGKLDAQKLYFGGQLKLSGNVMAAQKLQFLQKMDPAIAMKALNERLAKSGGGAGAAPSPQAAPADAGSDAPTSADVFVAIRHHLATHPELAPKVGTTFLFKLSNPDSAWLIDAKNGAGAVTQGTAAADVTLELSDVDFIGMASGKLDAQKLYFGGKLKIGGNVMAAQKLDFLKKVDPEAAKAAVLAERKKQGGSASSVNASAPAATAAAKAPAIFGKLKERLAQNANLASEVSAVLQFKTRSPAGAWVVDLKSKPASVREGSANDAVATITLDDEDLAALAQSTDGGRSLYQHGKVRIDGDAHYAQKLSFLKGL
jgi:3-hydroxyacyl-CoA dehydrogenase/3a,7a,12a-trihydroxy-5b-cholest-24-enoyl-CoA hydratase